MSNHNVAIIDYGSGNLFSVQRAVEVCGAENIQITSDPDVILSSDRVILPGVGAFKDAMDGLCDRGLDETVLNFVATGKPFLGICVGMQLLASEGYEGGVHKGLGIIDGQVKPISRIAPDGSARKVPFIGWSCLERVDEDNWNTSILSEVKSDQPVYFLHSYQFIPERDEDCLAIHHFHGERITAAVRRGNIFGVQFHPEKSRHVGLDIISTFLKISNSNKSSEF